MIEEKGAAAEKIAAEEEKRKAVDLRYPWQKRVLHSGIQKEIIYDIKKKAKNFDELLDLLYESVDKGYLKEVEKGDPEARDMEFYQERIFEEIPSLFKEREGLPRNRREQLQNELNRYSRTVYIDIHPKTRERRFFVPAAYLPYKEARGIRESFSEEERKEWEDKFRLGSEIIKSLNDKRQEFLKARKPKERILSKERPPLPEKRPRPKERYVSPLEKEREEFLKWRDTKTLSELLASGKPRKASFAAKWSDLKGERYFGILGVSSAVLFEGRLLSVEKVSKEYGNLDSLIKEIGWDKAKNILAQKDEEGKWQFSKDGKPIEPRLDSILKFRLLRDEAIKREEAGAPKIKEIKPKEEIKKEIELNMVKFVHAYEDHGLAEETKNVNWQAETSKDMDVLQRVIRESLGRLGLLKAEEVENMKGTVVFEVNEEETDEGKYAVKSVDVKRLVETPEHKIEWEAVYREEL